MLCLDEFTWTVNDLEVLALFRRMSTADWILWMMVSSWRKWTSCLVG